VAKDTTIRSMVKHFQKCAFAFAALQGSQAATSSWVLPHGGRWRVCVKAERCEVLSETRHSTKFDDLMDIAACSSIRQEQCAFCFFPIGRVYIPDNGRSTVMVGGRIGCSQRMENQRWRPKRRQGAETPLEYCGLPPSSHEADSRYDVSLISRAVGDFANKAHWSKTVFCSPDAEESPIAG
jgi:hypothetical protein